ncbi:MAG: hypothetical protein Q8Q09_22635 [Deltaproteobacteria bacterium]|nr:hypothetical protein [Deltaproteobacteria bacterium]
MRRTRALWLTYALMLAHCGGRTELEELVVATPVVPDVTAMDAADVASLDVDDTDAAEDVIDDEPITGWAFSCRRERLECHNNGRDAGIANFDSLRPAFNCCDGQCWAATSCPSRFHPRGACGHEDLPCDLSAGELCCPEYITFLYRCLRVGRRGCPQMQPHPPRPG